MVFGKLISDKSSVLARVEAAGSKNGAPNRDVRIVPEARLCQRLSCTLYIVSIRHFLILHSVKKCLIHSI